MDSEDRDEATKKLFQDFYKNPLNDEALGKLRGELQKLYPQVVWEDKHINTRSRVLSAIPSRSDNNRQSQMNCVPPETLIADRGE